MLGKGQNDIAFTFFKPLEREDMTIGGQPFYKGETGSPIFENLPAFIECKLNETVENGDHSVFVGEVVNAGVNAEPKGRPDEAVLWLKDLGEKMFYGG
jgi:flavin reductase (DIM6/NTAB) family NADH-FMN oxidoreductase RutF